MELLLHVLYTSTLFVFLEFLLEYKLRIRKSLKKASKSFPAYIAISMFMMIIVIFVILSIFEDSVFRRAFNIAWAWYCFGLADLYKRKKFNN